MDKMPEKILNDKKYKNNENAEIVANCLTKLVGAEFGLFGGKQHVEGVQELSQDQKYLFKHYCDKVGVKSLQVDKFCRVLGDRITEDIANKFSNLAHSEGERVANLKKLKGLLAQKMALKSLFTPDRMLSVTGDELDFAFIEQLKESGIINATLQPSKEAGMSTFIISSVNNTRRKTNPDVLETLNKPEDSRNILKNKTLANILHKDSTLDEGLKKILSGRGSSTFER